MSLISSDNVPGTRDWTILIFLSVIWGSSFILIKYCLGYFSPMQVGALRVLIASVAFFPLALSKWKQINWKLWPFYLVVGFCGSGIPAFLFPLAQSQLSSSIAGILNSLTPIFTLLMGYLLFSTKISKHKIFGVIAGFLGATVLTVFGQELEITSKIFYGLFIVGATVCYGISVNVVKEKMQGMNSTVLSSIAFSFLMPFAITMFFISGVPAAIATTPEVWKGLLYVSVLSLVGTFWASLLFYKMVLRTNAVFGSSVTYLIPIVSLMWGIADGESFTIFHVLGMFLILIGVYLSRKS